MKIFLIISLFCALIACKKKSTDSGFETKNSTLLYSVKLSTNVHSTSGTVNLYEKDGKKYIEFIDFNTDNGPDVRVYLSTDFTANNFVDLGTLKSNKGSFYYEIPSSVETQTLNHVLIWCQDYSVLFGSTILQ
jgi:hypothetical protein